MSDRSLPDGWVEKPMREVAGFSPKAPLEVLSTLDEVSFLPMAAVGEVSGKCDLSQTIAPAEGKRRNLTYFENEDILFAKITPCMENGKIARPVGLAGGRGFGSTEFHVLRPRSNVVGEYLRYFLVHDDFRIDAERAMTGAVGQRRVPRKYLEEHPIPVPPLQEQGRIVQILEEQLSRLDAAVKSVQTVREKAAQFRRSLLHAAFTGALSQPDPGRMTQNTSPESWPVDSLGQTCLKVQKVDPKVLGRPTFRYVDIGAIDNSRNAIRPGEPIDCETAPSRARQLIRTGDTVFSTVRPYLKNIAWVDDFLNGEIASTGFCVLRPDPESLLPRYLFFYSLSDVFLEQVLPLQRGVSYPAVRDADLLGASIPLPSLREQERIVEVLEEQLSRLDATLAVADEVERKANALRRSLLHAAFSGELTRSWREANV